MENILKVILWYRCGLISEREFLNAIDDIKGLEIPYEKELTNVK